MDRAVELGRRGWGRVHRNPMVGCVLVRDGEELGEGWHREWGGPHAEVEALRDAGVPEGGGAHRSTATEGATAYVSLEPCRHEGKTPPCSRALREAGVARLVFGALDPGAESGGGGEELRSAGVEVVGPILTPREARRENPVFFHRIPTRPWTVLKLALSLDGGIAPGEGRRLQLSGARAGEAVHHLRAGVEAILVGTRTAEVDDPLLTVRGEIEPRVPPVRVVVDLGGRLPPDLRLLREGEGAVWILSGTGSPKGWRRTMEDAGARVLEVEPARAGGRPSPSELLRRLREEGMRSLLCEGGGRFGSALLRSGAVDRLIHIWTPHLLGPDAVPGFPGGRTAGERNGMEAGGWERGEVRILEKDLWVEWDRVPEEER